MIQIFAHSSAGEGEPAYVEIWTPEILPCGSDKDPGKIAGITQGSPRLEKYLNLEDFLEKSLKVKSALKSTGKSLKGLEKSLNSTIFCRT